MTSIAPFLRKPLFVVFDHFTGAIECVTDLFEKNFEPIKQDEASLQNYLLSGFIAFGIATLLVLGNKKRYVPIITLLTCVIYSMQDKIKEAIASWSETHKFLDSTNEMLKNVEQWHMILFAIVLATIINYFFTSLMYIISFIIYACIITFIFIVYGNELNAFAAELPKEGPIKYLNHPAVILALLLLLFLLIHKVILMVLFAAVGTLMAGLIVESVFAIDKKPVKTFFTEIKVCKIDHNEGFAYWALFVAFSVCVQLDFKMLKPNK